jgi:urea carboxylase
LTQPGPAVLASLAEQGDRPVVTYRQAGDKYILLEYGPMVLDLRLRFRVHGLMEALGRDPIPGILELSPGVRSLQIKYDSRVIHQRDLLHQLKAAEEKIPPVETMQIETRVVHMPLAFEDSATLGAVAKYRQSVRDTAPWLPNNVDFIQRINGLERREDVRDIVFKTSYMILGLGDVYLGAPCAVPVDPRHRLLTSKYNPARTFTAEGTVGIGGVYMCIYGMDSPGGYQLIGRTLPIWNTFLKNPVFENGEPWLLKFFDQVRFYPVQEEELLELRESFREGKSGLRMERETFNLRSYDEFLKTESSAIEAFQAKQKSAFLAEVSRWKTETETVMSVEKQERPATTAEDLDGHVISSEIHGNVWQIHVKVGQRVKKDDPLVILEAMKMENWILSPISGVVKGIHCSLGKLVSTGDTLVVIETD